MQYLRCSWLVQNNLKNTEASFSPILTYSFALQVAQDPNSSDWSEEYGRVQKIWFVMEMHRKAHSALRLEPAGPATATEREPLVPVSTFKRSENLAIALTSWATRLDNCSPSEIGTIWPVQDVFRKLCAKNSSVDQSERSIKIAKCGCGLKRFDTFFPSFIIYSDII